MAKDVECQPGRQSKCCFVCRRSQLERIWKKFSVPIVFVLFVTMRAADRVLLKRVSNALRTPTYNLVLMNIIWPILIQVMQIFLTAGYVFVQYKDGNPGFNWRFFLPSTPLASARGAVPLYQFALFSLGDQLQTAIQAPPSAYISQTMQSVIANTSVVWTALMALLLLDTRFGQVHAIGCILILCSVLVGVSNLLQDGDCSSAGLQAGHCLDSYQGSDHVYHRLSSSSTMLWYGLLLIGTLPGSAGSIYKQHILQDGEVDIWYASYMSGNFQVLWGLCFIWTLWIPLPGQPSITPGETYQTLLDTWSCMSGNVPHPGDESCAEGGLPPMVWFIYYMAFNASFNLLMTWLTKRMSATWAQIATVLCLDLTNIFSQFRFLAGGGAQVMTLSDWLATVLASVSLWVYNLEPERHREKGQAYFSPWDFARAAVSLSRQTSTMSEPFLHIEELPNTPSPMAMG
eukprot:TRINITY_DN91971_c0_g1_i1.p1 TRINITY_DN91971_c0_g1~~TRINITY_DN91971_c0_g1_i1.p1  ORF type:complete len:458 (+),score=45.16 TRINITY_DN91971_c0_g1_i1:86-1459(+)